MAEIGSAPGEGSPPDEKTIRLNNDGQLENVSETIILGDFESGSGSWSNISRDSNYGAEDTTYSSENRTFGTGEEFISRSYDFTNARTLVFYTAWGHQGNDQFGTSNDKFVCDIGGTRYFSKDGGSTESPFLRVEIDVSSISGSKTIEIGHVNNSGNNITQNIDRIKIVNPDAKEIQSSDGAGN